MSGGAVCGQSEIGLGQTSSPAPPPQENAERKVMHCHSVKLPLAPSVGNDLRGQFFCAIETPLMLFAAGRPTRPEAEHRDMSLRLLNLVAIGAWRTSSKPYQSSSIHERALASLLQRRSPCRPRRGEEN